VCPDARTLGGYFFGAQQAATISDFFLRPAVVSI